MKRTLVMAALAALTLALGVAGCGSDTKSATPASDNGATAQTTDATSTAGTTLQLAADPNGDLKFDQTELTAKAGSIAIEFTNDSTTTHDVEVETKDEKSLGSSDQISESTTTLKLSDVKPGTYAFYCNLPGHEDAGMKGTLTVTEN